QLASRTEGAPARRARGLLRAYSPAVRNTFRRLCRCRPSASAARLVLPGARPKRAAATGVAEPTEAVARGTRVVASIGVGHRGSSVHVAVRARARVGRRDTVLRISPTAFPPRPDRRARVARLACDRGGRGHEQAKGGHDEKVDLDPVGWLSV